jgi:signal peptidase I
LSKLINNFKFFNNRRFLHTKYHPIERRKATILACIFLWSILIAFIIHKYLLGTVTIEGESMSPTLHNGERYIFHRWPYLFSNPGRGDIIVVQDDKDDIKSIKRVVALPGEMLEFRDGNVLINGQRVHEPYLREGTMTFPNNLARQQVAVHDREYFVLGDNRRESHDSRHMGAIDRAHVLGKIDK